MKWSDEKKREWHKWFAWHPITLINPDTGTHVTFWLGSVWRIRINGYYFPYWAYSGDDAKPKRRLQAWQQD
jgi:hypothetical protein